MSFDEWVATGIAAGYCGPVVCETHDGTPTTADEDEQFDYGGDPCIPVIRVYSDRAERGAVESNHSPSVWRKPRGGAG